MQRVSYNRGNVSGTMNITHPRIPIGRAAAFCILASACCACVPALRAQIPDTPRSREARSVRVLDCGAPEYHFELTRKDGSVDQYSLTRGTVLLLAGIGVVI